MPYQVRQPASAGRGLTLPTLALAAAALIATAVPVLPSPAHAQAYPVKPIRMIVNFPPGGGTDVTARLIQPWLTKELGQQIVLDNRGGAAGAVGAEIAARAAPDGYNLLWTLSSHTINPSLYGKLSFDTERDFVAITLGANAPQIVVSSMTLPVKDIKELIAYAKANPGKLSYASPGVGSPGHLAGELFKQRAGISMLHVPYKGAGPAIPDVISGNVQLMFATMSSSMSHVRAGKMRALGVTSLKRSAGGPDIPAIAEGLVGFEMPSWFGLLAPAGTPRPIIDRLHQAMVRVLAIPELRDQLVAQGADPVANTPDQFGEQIREELKLWAQFIKQTGIKPE
ncbi:MAG: tripartite tricarboxylate transporter substrate binding protein [Proteobacteria bacterium]|nr:tripartite tricarboxylate transporter substrate binding protein [Pseudomonadota bacterium]